MQITSTHELSQKEFEGLALDEPYLDLLGFVEWAFSILVWGRAGSGKSTFAMGLAKALLPFAKMRGGRVLYVSSEEGPHMTSSMRAARMGALDPDLLISDFGTIQALREAILRYDVQFLIVDSVTVVDPTTKEARDFLRWLRREGIGVVLVAHALKSGEGYKGNSRLGHDIYVEVECYRENAVDEPATMGEGALMARTIKNRYKPLAEIETPLSAREIVRTNPDCSTSPQSDQCKAIFASLDESGAERRTPKNGKTSSSKKSSSKKSSGKNKTSESKKSSAAGEFDAALSRIEETLTSALQ